MRLTIPCNLYNVHFNVLFTNIAQWYPPSAQCKLHSAHFTEHGAHIYSTSELCSYHSAWWHWLVWANYSLSKAITSKKSVKLLHGMTTAVQCSAVEYSALHCTALHCTALHCTALHYTALNCTALHCTALHCTALHCTAPHQTTLHWATVSAVVKGSLRQNVHSRSVN